MTRNGMTRNGMTRNGVGCRSVEVLRDVITNGAAPAAVRTTACQDRRAAGRPCWCAKQLALQQALLVRKAACTAAGLAGAQSSLHCSRPCWCAEQLAQQQALLVRRAACTAAGLAGAQSSLLWPQGSLSAFRIAPSFGLKAPFPPFASPPPFARLVFSVGRLSPKQTGARV